MVIVEQVGNDCVVTLAGETRRVKNCNALKLANTLFDKRGCEQYTPEEMCDFGFQRCF